MYGEFLLDAKIVPDFTARRYRLQILATLNLFTMVTIRTQILNCLDINKSYQFTTKQK